MNETSLSTSNSLSEVSILMTNFNKGEYIAGIFELSNVLLQKGAEIVIIDDGSTDGSFEKLSQFAANNEQIVLVSQRNQGSAAARNTAIRSASRKFIMFVDFDDHISVNSLETGMATLKESEVNFAILNYQISPGKITSQMPVVVGKPEILKIHHYRDDFFQSLGYWRYIYKRDFILANGLQFTPTFEKVGGLFILDDLFWVLHNCSLNLEIMVFPEEEVLYFYEQDLPSNSGMEKYQLQVMLFPKAMAIFLEELTNCEHDHDLAWLNKVTPEIVINHMKFLTFSQLIRTLPSYLLLFKSSSLIRDERTLKKKNYDLSSLVIRSAKNSILKIRLIRNTILHVRRR